MHLKRVHHDTFHSEVLPFQVAMGQCFTEVEEKSQFFVLNNAEELKIFWRLCTKPLPSAVSATTCVQFTNYFDKTEYFYIPLYI